MKILFSLSAIVLVLGMLGCSPQAGELSNTGAGPHDFRQIVRSATDKVFPAVVYLKVLREGYESGKKVTSEVAGSGVIISPKGELLTNWHVVDKAAEIRCLLYDGRAMKAKTIGIDKDTDLGLLQLELPKDTKTVPYAKLANSSDLKKGDFVMAMGAPWGLSRSVSIGIIACERRYLEGRSNYSLWLQTDASISPGNSGGPLVNTDGGIVGINTLATSAGGDMGFSVPSETARLIVQRLRKHGKMNWSWTGLQLQPLKDFNKDIYFEGDEGVIIAETDPESPARRGGLRVRDRILRVNGKPLNGKREEDLPAVRRALGLLPKAVPAKFDILRNGKPVTITITPREKGKVEGEELELPRWDMSVKTINRFDNEDLYFYRKKGLFVFGVKYPGNAAQAGLSSEDIIVRIDGKEIHTLEDIKKIHAACMKNVKKKHRVVVSVLRNGLLKQFVLDFSRDYEKE